MDLRIFRICCQAAFIAIAYHRKYMYVLLQFNNTDSEEEREYGRVINVKRIKNYCIRKSFRSFGFGGRVRGNE